jgi:hypothetical protein
MCGCGVMARFNMLRVCVWGRCGGAFLLLARLLAATRYRRMRIALLVMSVGAICMLIVLHILVRIEIGLVIIWRLIQLGVCVVWCRLAGTGCGGRQMGGPSCHTVSQSRGRRRVLGCLLRGFLLPSLLLLAVHGAGSWGVYGAVGRHRGYGGALGAVGHGWGWRAGGLVEVLRLNVRGVAQRDRQVTGVDMTAAS